MDVHIFEMFNSVVVKFVVIDNQKRGKQHFCCKNRIVTAKIYKQLKYFNSH